MAERADSRPDLHTVSWRKLRLAVLNRDGWVCTACGIALEGANATVDHIIPPSKGGTNEMHNLTSLCRPHNSQKQDRTLVRVPWFSRRWITHL